MPREKIGQRVADIGEKKKVKGKGSGIIKFLFNSNFPARLETFL
jgi:hypothetical protein